MSDQGTNNPLSIGIYIYDDAEVLDFSGPFEVFCTASRLSNDCFRVALIAESETAVKARGGFNVLPKFSFDDHPPIDLLVVVGGIHNAELKKPKVMSWIKETAANATIVSSVCTGSFLLAEAGLLSNRTVTTHWEDIEELRKSYPDVNVVEGKRWVEDGNYITSAGISAGIDMSLHLVKKLMGLTLATTTARQMQYEWKRDE